MPWYPYPPPPPTPADTCNHKGPDGLLCTLSLGHDGLHSRMVETSSGVTSTPWGPMPNTDYEIREWNDAGQRVLERPAVARAMKR